MNTQFMFYKISTSTFSLGVLFVIATPANAQQVFNVAADNFTSAANQSTNYGSNDKVNIENAGTGNYNKDRVGYFRFDMSAYTGGTISGATFTITPFEQFGSTSQTFQIYGISNGGASENFDENTLNWTNSGYAYSSGQGLSDSANFGDLVLLGELTGITDADLGDPVDFSSANLDSFLNNDNNNISSFIVYNTNGDGAFNGFASKENSSLSGATLTIVPEPSSVALLLGGTALVALGLKRRRRS